MKDRLAIYRGVSPLPEDFLTTADYATIIPMLRGFVEEAKANGFSDAKIATALAQYSIDHMYANDPGSLYDWTQAHAILFHEEFPKTFGKPKKYVKRRAGLEDKPSTH